LDVVLAPVLDDAGTHEEEVFRNEENRHGEHRQGEMVEERGGEIATEAGAGTELADAEAGEPAQPARKDHQHEDREHEARNAAQDGGEEDAGTLDGTTAWRPTDENAEDAADQRADEHARN